MTLERPHKHRTSDLWEAATLWALGFTASHTETDAGHVEFVFPEMGTRIDEAVCAYRAGDARVNALAMKQGYYQARSLIRSGLRSAGDQ
jgi:hypothetical protein